jgi:hypothetical protein
MGFNYQQPGKIKKADLVMLAAAIIVVGALIVWALLGRS